MDAITAMLQGFHDHLSQRSSTVLKLIYVVIDRDEVLKQFQQGLNQWASNPQVQIVYIYSYGQKYVDT